MKARPKPYIFPRRTATKAHLTPKGLNNAFVKYIDVIFDIRISWQLDMERIESTALRTNIKVYSIFKMERQRADIKLATN